MGHEQCIQLVCATTQSAPSTSAWYKGKPEVRMTRPRLLVSGKADFDKAFSRASVGCRGVSDIHLYTTLLSSSSFAAVDCIASELRSLDVYKKTSLLQLGLSVLQGISLSNECAKQNKEIQHMNSWPIHTNCQSMLLDYARSNLRVRLPKHTF